MALFRYFTTNADTMLPDPRAPYEADTVDVIQSCSPRVGSQMSWYTWYPRTIASVLNLSTLAISPTLDLVCLCNVYRSGARCSAHGDLVWELNTWSGHEQMGVANSNPRSSKIISAKLCASSIRENFAPRKYSAIRSCARRDRDKKETLVRFTSSETSLSGQVVEISRKRSFSYMYELQIRIVSSYE